MTGVYEDEGQGGGYTTDANRLHNEATQLLQNTIHRFLKEMTPEAVEYVVNHAVSKEIHRQKLLNRREQKR